MDSEPEQNQLWRWCCKTRLVLSFNAYHDLVQVLTDSLAMDWTPSQAAWLEKTEGVESVIDAVRRTQDAQVGHSHRHEIHSNASLVHPNKSLDV